MPLALTGYREYYVSSVRVTPYKLATQSNERFGCKTRNYSYAVWDFGH